MSTITSWNYATVPPPAPGSTKVFGRIITSRTDSGRYYEKRGEESVLLLPVGSMIAFAGTSAPGGYLLCDGAEVDRRAYADLFGVVGTRYGEGDGSTTFNVPTLAGPATGAALDVTVGYSVDKDMTNTNDGETGLPELPSEYAPNGVYVPSGSDAASYWIDWDNDLFDDYGFFYIFDPNANAYRFLVFNTTNQTDGVMATQTFDAFEGRTFEVTHGFCARGIYRFEIRCTSDSNLFVFGMYGDMGSDDITINTNVSSTISVGGVDYPITYNRNIEDGDEIERMFTYFVPFETSEFTSNPKAYTDNLNGDQLYFYSSQVTNGITVYVAKKNDVRDFIERDLQLVSGKIRGGAISLNSAGEPSIPIESSYIIKC